MSHKPKVTTTVRAQVTVDIEVGRWGGDGNFQALHKQASREAEQIVASRFGGRVRIVGAPKIVCVTHADD